MKGRMRPYLPELTIRDYNTYQWYQRGVRRQLYTTYGLYSCYGLRYNGVLFAVLADSLAGRPATCKRMREPTAAQTSVAAVAARNGAPATHPPRSAGKSENTHVSSTQTSAVAARAARVFGSFGAPPPSGGALGVHPLNAGVSAPAAAVPVQSARSRRDEIAAALMAQAEKRTGRTLQTNDEFMSEESSPGPMPEPPKGLTDLPSDAELAGRFCPSPSCSCSHG